MGPPKSASDSATLRVSVTIWIASSCMSCVITGSSPTKASTWPARTAAIAPAPEPIPITATSFEAMPARFKT